VGTPLNRAGALSFIMTPQSVEGAMPPAGSAPAEPTLPPSVRLAFAPLHKRAFGLAVGVALGIAIAGATLVYLARGEMNEGPGLWLLRQYLAGYRVSLAGAFVGGLWGLFIGFVAGWFFAFCRNFAIAMTVFIFRVRAELSQSRDFLDHI
jgi:hypothetical protein